MTKRLLNQNAKYFSELEDLVEPNFVFNEKPINRLNKLEKSLEKNTGKSERLTELKNQINSIENCNLKNKSKKLIMGEGELNSPIMLIGENPGKIENETGVPFQGEVGQLLDKMLKAIEILRKKIYVTYAINFITPEDRKPTSQEIRRYSFFLKEHISIINPKIIVLMGATSMEAITGLKSKISTERGKWKEIIIKNKSIPVIVTFSPSYLIRYPENKKYSWEDLKKIREKIKDLNIKI
tara:strand:- start:681 stop:1397 length:717 start_codon:yes stop_codon:yes gene_type:complete